ncbi:MAG: tagaturonate reductase [Bacteroidaceae bacterium]|nr:tagaturonate reductase [Bacteroidaceae bacterium]
MQPLNSTTAPKTQRPERIIQFGEGNFLRAFVDWIVWQMDKKTDFNASVVIVQPIAQGMADRLQEQDCLYHVNLQGLIDGKPVNSLEMIDSVSRALNPYENYEAYIELAEQPEIRFVISNTTEAGIAIDPTCRFADTPPASYPAKLTQLLYHRFCAFNGDPEKGLIIMPCELIFQNGHHLVDCIRKYIELWRKDLGADFEVFRSWFEQSCYVCTTLVDRIVPGFPRKDIEAIQQKVNYADNMVVQAEAFHLWVIETAPNLSLEQLVKEFPADKAGLHVIMTHDESPYHERKVTLLNGPHTVLSPVAFLAGLNIVRNACQHEVIGPFVRRVMYDELLPTLNLPENELRRFADDVMERFCNPFVDHQLTSIMLNSFSKFQTRDLPGLKTYLQRKGQLPKGIVLGLAAICVYYKGGQRADGTLIQPNDDSRIMQLLTDLWATGDARKVAEGVLAAKDLIWHEQGDHNNIPGLTDLLTESITSILNNGMMETVKKT